MSSSIQPLVISGIVGWDQIQVGRAREFPKVLGGAGLYGAIAASAFSPTELHAVVGSDVASLLTLLNGKRLSTAGVQVIGKESFAWRGYYPAVDLPVQLRSVNMGPVTLPRRQDSVPAGSWLVCLNDDPRAQVELVRRSSPDFLAVGLNRQWLTARSAECKWMLSCARLAFLDKSEARILGDLNDLMRPGAIAVITDGPRALAFLQSGKTITVPVSPIRDVFDPTGAGDVLAASLASLLHATRATPHIENAESWWKGAHSLVEAKLRTYGAIAFASLFERHQISINVD